MVRLSIIILALFNKLLDQRVPLVAVMSTVSLLTEQLWLNLSNSLCNFTRNNSYCWAGQQQRPFVIIGFAITFVSIITLYSESIRNRNQGSILSVSVSEPKLFFLKLKLFFFKFSPTSFWIISFYKLQNKTRS